MNDGNKGKTVDWTQELFIYLFGFFQELLKKCKFSDLVSEMMTNLGRCNKKEQIQIKM